MPQPTPRQNSSIVRKGDAVRILGEAVTSSTGTVSQQATFAEITFANAGTSTVSSGANAITVTVIGAEFPEANPACMLGVPRVWQSGVTAETAIIEGDSTIKFGREDAGKLSLEVSEILKPHHLIARAGENGPILDDTRVDCFWIQAAPDSYLWVVKRYEDGSELWEQSVVTRQVPPTVDIKIRTIISGVMLEDGTLERWLTSADLDELGEYRFRLIKAPENNHSTCHIIKVYQDGEDVGEANYAGKLLPNW